MTDVLQARCKHFGSCGGCKSQDVAYDAQLAEKSRVLRELFAAHRAGEVPVYGSPVQWHYRNKIDPTFSGKHYETPPPKDFKRETVLGFKAQGRWFSTMDTEECKIFSEDIGPLLENVRTWVRAEDLQPFDSRRKTGFLKNLLVREGKRTGQKMVVLVTRFGDIDSTGFVNAVLDVYPATSIHLAPTESLSSVAYAEQSQVLHGTATIDEELWIADPVLGERKLKFRVSPFSFLQTNTLATESLYVGILERVLKLAPTALYDLYGGCGGIAFTCAPHVAKITSVENVQSATEDGEYNARVNGIDNVAFITAGVETYLTELAASGPLPEGSLFVMDPPRAGLHPKALKQTMELLPENILYISCKPTVLAQEFAVLQEKYTIAELCAYDLFPHTEHVEVLAHLVRR